MLQEVRLKKGWSQSKLAKESGISLSTIQKYERGAANINHANLDTLLTLCIKLECDLKEILTDEYTMVLLAVYKEEYQE